MSTRCDVYWGSHGCRFTPAHEGPHFCDCCDCVEHGADGWGDTACVGGPPYYGDGTEFYGDDA